MSPHYPKKIRQRKKNQVCLNPAPMRRSRRRRKPYRRNRPPPAADRRLLPRRTRRPFPRLRKIPNRYRSPAGPGRIRQGAGRTAKNPRCAKGICGYVACVNWQQIISLTIVALAAGLLLWGRLRRRRFSFRRDLPCGCSSGRESAAQQGSIVFRARKGERREVIVKMR